MLSTSQSSTFVAFGFFVFAITALLNVPVASVMFVEYTTGLNPDLKSYEIFTTITRTEISCGRICKERKCESFIFQASNKNCRLFSAFMTSPGDVIDGIYYVRSTVVEHFDLVETTCRSGSLSSSMTNVALNKPVTMSSMHQYPPTPTPEMLTDGNRSDVYPCPHSELETNPEAIIDLEQTYGITEIYIVNRVDCCPQRLHDLIIQIGDNLSDLKTVFNHTSPIGDTCKILFGAPQHGRYVKLYIEGTEYLTICEVEVYSDL